MSIQDSAVEQTNAQLGDLGPLAWVLDELRKSLDGATKAMRRYVREADLARGSELTELDTSHLRVARQQLHQAVGALEMVGLPAPARVLRGMETLAQRFVQRPELCSEDAAHRVEHASFALTEFLESVLKGRPVSPVALFPQYRDVMEVAGAERVHPADLWSYSMRWQSVASPQPAPALGYDPAVRARMDPAVLKIVKTGDAPAAMLLSDVCAGLAAGPLRADERSFWAIAAGFFQALGHGGVPVDVYTKRTASRILQQYASLAKAEASPSEQLAHELLFYCAQATGDQAPAGGLERLQAVRQAFGLQDHQAVDYDKVQYGRIDPAQLVQARKRIATAAETWSALAGGDLQRLDAATEQFANVTDSLQKLQPESSGLARALTQAMDAVARSGAAPRPAVAMEVATTVLYLEAVYEDFDPNDTHAAERGERMALRLQHVTAGAESEPLEGWMEDLYRKVSDRQTMGSVVDELRGALGEVENALDQYFRNPADKTPLRTVPARMGQMRGVFSVLGMDQPSLAALRMRDRIEKLLVADAVADAATQPEFERLGNSLGAMGLLIDMLGYQRALAKKLFVYDEALGELRPLMGRERQKVAAVPAPAASVPVPPAASVVTPAPAEDDDAQELREIFLEEAREVVQNGQQALSALQTDPANLADLTTVRRAFHTLKGSSRMVGLKDFGEAAWSFEQMLNAWLAEQKPATPALLDLSHAAMQAFSQWIEAIAQQSAQDWSPQPFRASSDAYRLDGSYLPLQWPGSPPPRVQAASAAPAQAESTSDGVQASTTTLDAGDTGDTGDAEEQDIDLPDFVSTLMMPEAKPAPPEPAASESGLGIALDFDVPVPPPSAASTEPDRGEGSLLETPRTQDDSVPEVAVLQGHAPDFAATEMFEAEAVEKLPEFEATRPFEAEAPSAPVDAPDQAPEPLLSLGDLDFGDLAAPPPRAEIPDIEPKPEPESNAPVAIAQQSNTEPTPLEVPEDDEQTKVIGPLRLSIPLYNVYLNEADEWSRQLQMALGEWSLELHRPLPDAVVRLAHSLVGSSATVGFSALSDLARLLEHSLLHVQGHGPSAVAGTPAQAEVFNRAADDIRRLLHQFAAGFLKDADPAVQQALQDILDADLSPPSVPSSPQTEAALALPVSPAPAQAPASPAAQGPAPLQRAALPPTSVQDRLDPDLFPVFQEEAQDLLPALGTALRQWVARPAHAGARAEALRLLHTLKGSARLAGALQLGDRAHRMESDIEQISGDDGQAAQIEPLLASFDALQNHFLALGRPAQDAGPQASDAADRAPSDVADGGPQTLSDPDGAAAGPGLAAGGAGAAPVLPEQTLPAVPAATLRPTASHTVRVRSQLLDRLLNEAGEVMISRARLDSRVTVLKTSLAELTGNLDRLRNQLREMEVQSESQMQSRLALSKEAQGNFDPLEFDRFTRVQELTRMMAESVNDVATVQRTLQREVDGAEDDLRAQGRQTRELQRDLLHTRMVEFEAIADRLYGVVRQASKEAGKQVRLEIIGGDIEMDRGVLDRMTPAFEHLLRNAVGHGIEYAEGRAAAGKPPIGTVTIAVRQEGNDVFVSFSDDGHGLHMERIRERAVARQLMAPDAELTPEQAAQLLFAPGFTTADKVTELSGRGIGMDVVSTEVHSLGGRIETSTTLGQGTRFTLVLPLTTAVTQVVMLRLGDFTLGVPSNLVQTLVRVTPQALQQAYEQQVFALEGVDLPFFWGGALLGLSRQSSETAESTLPVAIFRSAGQQLAMHVDEVLGNREVVVKNLGPQLARLPGLAGMSMLASGAVVLIYNPVALATVYGERLRNPDQALTGFPSQALAHGAAPAPLVMVVDDSITVRRVTQRLLKREGFRVVLANDGQHALEQLQQERPAVILSDIEMPRMDGFDFVRQLRADETLRDLPVIMITSRIAQKHRDLAQQLGVSHYLGKPYAEDELLTLIRQYCHLAATE